MASTFYPLVIDEQRGQPVLLVGEQPGSGVQRRACGVERVVLVPAVIVDGLLDPASTSEEPNGVDGADVRAFQCRPESVGVLQNCLAKVIGRD